MRRLVNQYFQYNQRFLTTTLNFETLNNVSEVLKYGEHKLGYQREVNELHLSRMVHTLKETNDILSPTSIILGVNSYDIEKCLEELAITADIDLYSQENLLLLDTGKIDFKFRIVDGQHRIAAFNKLLSDPTIEEEKKENLMHNYLFNIVIVVLEEKNRIDEVEIFRAINSKAKPLKTDLAMLAKYKYEIYFKKRDIDLVEHIKTRIIFILNENEMQYDIPYWVNGIKVEVNDKQALGSIAFKAFGDSINKIVKQYVNKRKEKFETLLEEDFEGIDNELNHSATELIKELLLPAWDTIFEKWPESFKETKSIQLMEVEKTYYNKNYYIQQTMGVKSLHGLLSDIYLETNNVVETIHEFKELIKKSSLTSADWEKNGKMKGLSSEAGFKIIREMIKN
ncbi:MULTISPECIES: DNA sulfur modification protein DndB [Staphylococcaceae]|jgi:DGQHR domain-containing protein|uniref:DNA sulfur modification protein DndB n=1 Tax=Staphylococcaceae TaxID=90964 RepID=UPI001642D7FC|nr:MULTISPECIES: DNA sulfur modification protein DndB [Staphylococcaceae]MBC2919672.1 hypothetical protein [Staphylococcus saprophyticus]MBC2956959.1 hypothetical protein [Staphylococcus saprophyticus]MBC3008919.1 hypothetical protein [Staphylococcus saprophyticus]MBC3021990.1 hypothetical protein [Staphylococcus saprophyticus]MBC3029943.1 hypothetical protein [Staphylococcus saprophyticus]